MRSEAFQTWRAVKRGHSDIRSIDTAADSFYHHLCTYTYS